MLLGGLLANISWQAQFLGYLIALLILPRGLIALAGGLPKVKRSADDAPPDLPDVPLGSAAFVFISAVFASAMFFITPVQLPFYLRDTFAATPLQMGAAIALGNSIGAISSLAYAQLKRRINFVDIYAAIYLSMALGYFVVAAATSYATALIGMVVAGIRDSAAKPAIINAGRLVVQCHSQRRIHATAK